MDKFSRLAALLAAEGLSGPSGFHQPELIDVETLRLAHTEDYVRGVLELSLPADVVRRIGMPNSESVATRARKALSDLDIDLADGTGDEAYLARLAEILPALLDRVEPDLVFFNAGVDPHVDDKLGRLSLSHDGLGRREAYVLGLCLARDVPVAGVIGGGYDPDIDRLADRHAILHRTAAGLLGV